MSGRYTGSYQIYEGRVRNFFTYMKTRFYSQILYRNSSMYLRYLRIIDKKSEQVEEKLHFSPRNHGTDRAFGTGKNLWCILLLH